MTSMKKTRKILPVSIADISGLEHWLEEQADNGLFPVSIGTLATFTAGGVPGTRFRLEPDGTCGDAPTEEQLALYRDAGWEYAFAVRSMYFLFYTTDPDAVELYCDHESRGLSLERLEAAVLRVRRRMILICCILAAVMIWMLFFYENSFDVQPEHFAYLPLLLLRLFDPVFLVFLIGLVFIMREKHRDLKLLTNTCKALRAGLAPPPSPGPSRRIVFEHVMSLAAIIPLFLLLLGQRLDWSPLAGNLALDDLNRPYIEIQALERTPVYRWEDLFGTSASDDFAETDSADVRHSLLAPTWYSVTQQAYSPQDGTHKGTYSPDPENGAYRYAPQLETTYFHLLIPAMARSIAQAQLDAYRLVNLRWSYESVTYADLDFVILADEPDGIWQMAALGKDGNVAVFRYGGQEQLRDHLELLSTSLR